MDSEKNIIELDTDNRIVRVVLFGKIFKEEGQEVITRVRKMAAEHQFNIFYDMRHSEAMVEIIDWYNLPRQLGVLKDTTTRTARVALLISADKQRREYQFYETVAYNAALDLRVFLEEEKEIDWLRGKK